MKKGRLLVLAAASAAFCAAAVACGGKHEHEYGAWTITADPTLTAEGSATRTCTSNDGGVETVAVPALSNTDVWTAETNDATHTAAGKIVYTSVYGTVEVTIPQGEHSWGGWTITKAPTATETGTAERACSSQDGGKDSVTLPVLTDTSVWTKDASKSKPASHAEDGKDVYTSAYGTVEVVLPKGAGTHTWGEWEITVKPTLEKEGEATRKCTANDGGTDTQKLAALSNALMWKKDAEKSTPATHTEDGKDVYTSAYGTVEVVIPKDADAHTYGDWTITKAPTATETGTAERICEADNQKDTAILPVLTDTSVWTKDTEKSKPNSHTEDGKDVYTSEYGTVEIVVPKSVEHVWGDWEITKAPTLTEAGTAKHSCTLSGCTEQDVTAAVPVLTDTAVWTKQTVEPDYNNAGKDVYTSEYGTVELPGAPKLVAPYEGKTYIPILVEINGEGKISVTDSWRAAQMVLDANGEGTGTAYPYMNETWKVSMVDAGQGIISIVTQSKDTSGNVVKKTYTAYVDMATGVIVRPREASWSTVFVFLPYEWEEGKSKVEAAILDESIAITYSKDDVSESSFVFNDKAFFGVTFASDKAGAHEISVAEFAEKDLVYVLQNSKLIASFAKNSEGVFVPADGLEGTYALTDPTGGTMAIFVSGSGMLKYENGEVIGYYTVAEEGADYTISVILENIYYEIILNADFTGSLTMPTVTVKYVVGEGFTAIPDEEFNKNAVADLAVPEDTQTKIFGGWYFDEAYAQPVPDKFIPTADVTLYAKWSDKGSIGVIVEEGGAALTVYFGEGNKLSDVLSANNIDLGVDEAGWRVFRGWYLDADYSRAISAETTLSHTDSGKSIYAKWEALPEYYGEYAGNALNPNAQYCFGASVKLDENGVVTLNRVKNSDGETEVLKGTVIGYNKTTQLLTWQASGSDAVYNMRVDSKSGFIAFASEMKDSALGQNPYILSRNGDTVTTDIHNFGFYNGSSSYNHTCIVSYQTEGGATKTLLVYTDTIYADVTVSDYKDTALAINEVANSKTLVVKQNGTVVLALGSTGVKISGSGNDELGVSAKLQLLDAYYGVYTVNGKDYKLNGLGQIEWDGVGGTASAGYTFVKEENGFRIFDVFERKVVSKEIQVENPLYDPEDYESEEFITQVVLSYEPVGYYQLKVATAGGANAFEKIMVTVTVKNATGTGTADGTAQVNAKVAILPEAPVDPTGASVFVGWYKNPELTEEFTATAFEVGDTPTLYAKWDTRRTVTAHFNYEGAPENAVYEFAHGASTEIPTPEREGYYLVGWFTDAACSEGSEWTDGQAITANVEIYAKWALAAQMAGTYKGFEKWVNTQGKDEAISGMSTLFTCQLDGSYTATRAGSGTISETHKPVVDGEISLGRYAYFNKTAGVMWYAYGTSTTSVGTDAYFCFDTSRIASVSYSINKDIKVNNTAKLTAWLTLNYVDGSTMNVLCYNEKIYDNVTWTAGVSVNGVNNANEIQVWDKEGAEILLKVKSGSTFVDPKAERGTYTNAQSETLFLNGGNAITYGDKKGTYSAVSGKDYNFNVDFGSERWWLTIDQEAKTFSIKKPMATVTFDMNGKGESVTAEQNVSKFLSFSTVIASDPVADGFIFRGWYENAECTGSAKTSYTPSDETPKTFYAKWDKAITVTLDYGGKLDNVTVEGKYVGDTYTLTLPAELVDGQGAEGWYTDPEFTDKVTGSYTFTDDTVFYCKWVDAHPLTGTYKGVEFDSTALRGSSAKTLVVGVTGTLSNAKTGTLVAGEGENVYTYDNGKYLYYDPVSKTIVVNYGSDTTLGTDLFVLTYVEDPNTTISGSYKNNNTDAYLVWNSNYTKLGKFGVNGVEKFFFVHDGKVYGNVTVEVNGVSISDLTKIKESIGNELVIKDMNGDVVLSVGWNGSDFVNKDGTQGTYTGTIGGTEYAIEANGYGGFSIGGEILTAVLDGTKLAFTLNNSMKVVTLDTENKTYAQVQDGFAGTYTLPDGTSTIVFDGLGGAGDGKTYVVDGATVTVYESNGSKTAYGIDVTNKTLAGKSKFAGYTFTGTYHDSYGDANTAEVIFDDGVEITGKIIANRSDFFFTGVLEGNTLTITWTKVFNNTMHDDVGKTLIFTIEGDTMTRTGGTYSNNAYMKDLVATCEGFSL